MGSQFKYPIEDKCATLEEYVAPIPTIVLHYVVCFSLDPKIKTNKRNATKPSANKTLLDFTSRQIPKTITLWHGRPSKDFQELGNS